ncbi:hypothetical protein ACFL1Y_00285 [Patescibacteria group bacterium]
MKFTLTEFIKHLKEEVFVYLLVGLFYMFVLPIVIIADYSLDIIKISILFALICIFI